MFSQSFTVTGMHCGHCAATLTEEFDSVAGVRNVTVDVPTGHVTVTSEQPFDHSDIRRIVKEAGFAVAAPVEA